MSEIGDLLDSCYNALDGSETADAYSGRHGIVSQAVLTVTDDETASLIASYIAPRIEGKTVVEIGGGIGLLAFHLADHAKRVYCIEANPAWTWCFLGTIYTQKPKNVSFLFGAADEFFGLIRADVALFCTHSGVSAMRATAALFAPEVIDVYGQLIAEEPDRFDTLARKLRETA